MTDLQILGLNESFSCDELKSAYRRKSKQFHPDINHNNLNSHLAMIRLNLAYSNLLKKLEKQQNRVNDQMKDDGYSVYRQGITHFQSIHPSKWKRISSGGIFNAHAINTSPVTPEIISSLLGKMAQAYHKFSIIVVEYENSPWYSDALEKMGVIEKMTIRYKKIKESYEAEIKNKSVGQN